MKITVITDSKGRVAGTIKGHVKDFYAGDINAGPFISDEMKLHEIEIPDEFEKYYSYTDSQQAGVVGQEGTKKQVAAQEHEKLNLEDLHKKAAEHIKK